MALLLSLFVRVLPIGVRFTPFSLLLLSLLSITSMINMENLYIYIPMYLYIERDDRQYAG